MSTDTITTHSMTLQQTVQSAISDSIQFSTIKRVVVTSKLAQVEYLNMIETSDIVLDSDYATESDGSLDVWGHTTGRNIFRIRIEVIYPDFSKI